MGLYYGHKIYIEILATSLTWYFWKHYIVDISLVVWQKICILIAFIYKLSINTTIYNTITENLYTVKNICFVHDTIRHPFRSIFLKYHPFYIFMVVERFYMVSDLEQLTFNTTFHKYILKSSYIRYLQFKETVSLIKEEKCYI